MSLPLSPQKIRWYLEGVPIYVSSPLTTDLPAEQLWLLEEGYLLLSGLKLSRTAKGDAWLNGEEYDIPGIPELSPPERFRGDTWHRNVGMSDPECWLYMMTHEFLCVSATPGQGFPEKWGCFDVRKPGLATVGRGGTPCDAIRSARVTIERKEYDIPEVPELSLPVETTVEIALKHTNDFKAELERARDSMIDASLSAAARAIQDCIALRATRQSSK